ncbi:unknown [Subdoligranulum sp. CAG:314]|nr:unknown [Subdoligranulum sp. CAG:314]
MLVGFVAGGVLTVVVVLSALDGWTFVGQLVNLLLGAGMAAGGVAILLNNCEKYFYAVE